MDKILYKQNTDPNSYKLIMAYPASKEFALSSLGYMWLYKTVCEMPEIDVDMVCTDTKGYIRANKSNAISFSLSFDFDFMGVFEILERNSIPFLAKDRDEKYPILFAGGPVITTNPKPYSNIFDFMIIGDGEKVLGKVLEVLKGFDNKDTILKELSKLEGVYVPNISAAVNKITESLSDVIYTPIISEESYFKDTFIIEVARGCMNRCAFCTASYLNLPFRNYEYQKIIDVIDLGLKYTDNIALLGAQISAHPDFNRIMEYLKVKIEDGRNIKLGISSLRTDAISPELVKTLVMGGQKTSTIAIEAASDRLRRFINKNITREQIFNAVKISRENGLKGLKIYSMIGIPSETDDDVESFISLAKDLKAENKGFDITFSFSSFVPKPQTPFQWCKREDTNTLEKKQKYIEKQMAKLGIESKFSSIKWDYWQTVLSRGDTSLSELLVYVYKNGGKNGAYKSGIKSLDIDISKALKGYSLNEQQPWDFIISYPGKELLLNEYKRLSTK